MQIIDKKLQVIVKNASHRPKKFNKSTKTMQVIGQKMKVFNQKQLFIDKKVQDIDKNLQVVVKKCKSSNKINASYLQKKKMQVFKKIAS